VRTTSWRGRAAALFLAGTAVAALVSSPAGAQVQLPSSILPGRDRPIPAPNPETDFDFRIESPRRSPVPRAVDELRFPLQELRINGVTIFSQEDLRPLYADLLGTEVGLSNILAVAEAIENKYRAAGYIITRAFVPPQRVRDGVFEINVVEGYVRAASVEGGSPETRAVIEAYLSPVTLSRPLRSEVLERALLLTNDLPGVQASGLLRPSDEPGAADLVVTVNEVALTGGLSTDNRGSKFAGPWTINGDATYTALPGGPHGLTALVSVTPNALERMVGQLRYVRPFGTNGLQGSLGVTYSYGEPGSTLQPFDLQTESFAIGPRVTYPLLRTRANTVLIDAGLTVQYASVNTGVPAFRSTPGLETYDNWRVADVAVTYSNSGFLLGATTVTLGLAQGLDILDASSPGIKRSRPDGHPDFTKITAAVRRVQLIEGPFSAYAAMVGQYAFGGLFAGEQIAFGGAQIGRGYDPGGLTGDSGIGGTFEFRYDEKFPEYYIENAQFYGFYDVATVDNRSSALLSHSLNSAGGGARLTLPQNVSVNFELAQTLESVATSDNGKFGTSILFGAGIRF
jgi:hemolysin activation/secretion protein